MCNRKIVDHSASLTDLSGLDESVGVALLREVIARQRLTFGLAQVFIRSFPDTELSACLKRLDLYAGLPPPSTGRTVLY